MLRLLCFLPPVCVRALHTVKGKYLDRLLSSFVAYNGLFFSQYNFINLEDSFVHFCMVNTIQVFQNYWKRVELTSLAVP